MTYTLGSNVQPGQKIKTSDGWRKILTVGEKGVIVKEGPILFGDTVYGWKAS